MVDEPVLAKADRYFAKEYLVVLIRIQVALFIPAGSVLLKGDSIDGNEVQLLHRAHRLIAECIPVVRKACIWYRERLLDLFRCSVWRGSMKNRCPSTHLLVMEAP